MFGFFNFKFVFSTVILIHMSYLGAALAQDSEIKPGRFGTVYKRAYQIKTTQSYDVISSENNMTYTVNLSFPYGYSSENGAEISTFYYKDGDLAFPTLAKTANLLDFDRVINPVLTKITEIYCW
jgi:hypothetical protein